MTLLLLFSGAFFARILFVILIVGFLIMLNYKGINVNLDPYTKHALKSPIIATEEFSLYKKAERLYEKNYLQGSNDAVEIRKMVGEAHLFGDTSKPTYYLYAPFMKQIEGYFDSIELAPSSPVYTDKEGNPLGIILACTLKGKTIYLAIETRFEDCTRLDFTEIPGVLQADNIVKIGSKTISGLFQTDVQKVLVFRSLKAIGSTEHQQKLDFITDSVNKFKVTRKKPDLKTEVVVQSLNHDNKRGFYLKPYTSKVTKFMDPEILNNSYVDIEVVAGRIKRTVNISLAIDYCYEILLKQGNIYCRGEINTGKTGLAEALLNKAQTEGTKVLHIASLPEDSQLQNLQNFIVEQSQEEFLLVIFDELGSALQTPADGKETSKHGFFKNLLDSAEKRKGNYGVLFMSNLELEDTYEGILRSNRVHLILNMSKISWSKANTLADLLTSKLMDEGKDRFFDKVNWVNYMEEEIEKDPDGVRMGEVFKFITSKDVISVIFTEEEMESILKSVDVAHGITTSKKEIDITPLDSKLTEEYVVMNSESAEEDKKPEAPVENKIPVKKSKSNLQTFSLKKK